jgi:hypothetical protein
MFFAGDGHDAIVQTAVLAGDGAGGMNDGGKKKAELGTEKNLFHRVDSVLVTCIDQDASVIRPFPQSPQSGGSMMTSLYFQ